jgi:pilus assembly protein CpaB
MLKGKTPLIVALVLGLLAGVVAYSAIKKKEADVRRGWNLVPVVVAAVDIPEGTVVGVDMISQRSVPEQFVTSSVVKPDSASYVVNQKVLVALQAGDPLLWSQFETTKAAERLSTKIQKKGRAITIDASKTAAVGGWVRPNDHVDVIGTFRDPQTNENTAVTLLQNVIVLATGKVTGTTNVNLIPEQQREYSNVSLLVIPEEAEILVLAAELGGLVLSLRNEEDVDMQEERTRTTIHTLLSGERTKVLQEKRREIIQIIKGNAGGTAAGTPK